MSTAKLNVGFKHARGCYDWRVDLQDRRGEMKGWKSITVCLWLDFKINVSLMTGCKCMKIRDLETKHFFSKTDFHLLYEYNQ